MARDDEGATTTSTAVNVSVNSSPANVAPTVNLTSPLDGASFLYGEAIALAANADDADGTVASVAFYEGANPLGTVASAPYSFTWSPLASGNYTLTAVATDDLGKSTTSQAVSVTVAADPNAQAATLQEGLGGYQGTEDAYLYEYHNYINFGPQQYLIEKPSVYRNRSLIRFTIFQSEGGPVPDGATITSATLSLYKYTYYNYIYRLHPILNNWTEGEVTWDDRVVGMTWQGPGANGAGSETTCSGIGSTIGASDRARTARAVRNGSSFQLPITCCRSVSQLMAAGTRSAGSASRMPSRAIAVSYRLLSSGALLNPPSEFCRPRSQVAPSSIQGR